MGDAESAPPSGPFVFISHTFVKDREVGFFALLLNECLKHEGVSTFTDVEMEEMVEYKNKIMKSVQTCDLFVCLLCPMCF